MRKFILISLVSLILGGVVYTHPQILLPGGGNASTTLIGTITDAQGNGVNGSLTLQLPVPSQFNASLPGCVGNSQLVQNSPIVYQLVNGAIQSGPSLFDVKCLSPANLFYVATAYDRTGALLMRGNFVVTGSLFNIGTATPTTQTTSNISYANIAGSISTSQANTWTAPQTFAQINSNTGSIAASGLIRLANTDVIAWRNGNNSSDVQLGLSDSATGGTTTCTNAAPCLISGGATQTFAGTGTCPANQFANSLNAIALAVPGAPTCAAITVLASGATGTNTALTTPTIGGTTITNVPVMTLSGYYPLSSINASNTTSFTSMPVVNGITILDFRYNGLLSPMTGCSPFPQVSVEDNGSPVSTITMSTAASQTNSSLSINVAAGHTLSFNQSSGGSGCSSTLAPTFIVTYRMQ